MKLNRYCRYCGQLFSNATCHSTNSPRRGAVFITLLLAGAVTVPNARAFMLEETIVTAQKRPQSLQDVPISVSVTKGEKLDQFSLNGLEDFSASIPNVTIMKPNTCTQDLLGKELQWWAKT